MKHITKAKRRVAESPDLALPYELREAQARVSLRMRQLEAAIERLKVVENELLARYKLITGPTTKIKHSSDSTETNFEG